MRVRSTNLVLVGSFVPNIVVIPESIVWISKLIGIGALPLRMIGCPDFIASNRPPCSGRIPRQPDPVARLIAADAKVGYLRRRDVLLVFFRRERESQRCLRTCSMFIHSANSDRKRSIGYGSVERQELNVPLLIGEHGPVPCFIEPTSRYVTELVPQHRQSPCGWTPQVGDSRTPGRRAAFMSEGRGGTGKQVACRGRHYFHPYG